MVSVFSKMLLREISKTKKQFIAAVAVVLSGISLFTSSYSSYINLEKSLSSYYEQYKFMDYWADVNNLSEESLNYVKSIPGVEAVTPRLSMNIPADMGSDKRVTLRLITLPDTKKNIINDLYYVKGGYFNANNEKSCLISQKFASFYNLDIGSTVKIIINGKTNEFKIDGIVNSTEFIYPAKSADSIFTSEEYFGIIYINESVAKNILDRSSLYNQLLVRFQKGTNTANTIDSIEDCLKLNGFISGTERKDQLSHIVINGFTEQMKSMAYMFPSLFIFVAILMIYILIKRIIYNQRIQIAVMKAFGYSDNKIMSGYICYCLLISVVGCIPGVFIGLTLGKILTSLFVQVFSIPIMEYKIPWGMILIGTMACTIFCVLASFNSIRTIISIQPAQAMRSEAPTVGKKIFLERISILWQRLSFGWKISLRNIFRNRQRTAMTLLGSTFAIIFFIISLFFVDSVDYIMNRHFFQFQSQDYKITFNKYIPVNEVMNLKNINGIQSIEPIMEVPVEIQNGWKKKNTMMVGLINGRYSYKFVDENRNNINLPGKGVLLSESLANTLSVKPGDKILVKPLVGNKEKKYVTVNGIAKEYIGFNCYMDLKEAANILDEPEFSSGALVKVEGGSDSMVKKELNKVSGIDGIEIRLESFKLFGQILKFMNLYIGLMVIFGIIMGFAVIFNTTVINITERRRELASLKVLGYSNRELENTILRENIMLGIISIIPGILISKLICNTMAKMFSLDIFILDPIIYPRTYIITIVSVFVIILLSEKANVNSITDLDIIEVLRNREG